MPTHAGQPNLGMHLTLFVLGGRCSSSWGATTGHADSFLVQAGSGVATLGLPDSPGVPASSTGARRSGEAAYGLHMDAAVPCEPLAAAQMPAEWLLLTFTQRHRVPHLHAAPKQCCAHGSKAHHGVPPLCVLFVSSGRRLR